MKHTNRLLIFAMLAVLFIAACERAEENAALTPSQTLPPNLVAEVAAATRDSAQQMTATASSPTPTVTDTPTVTTTPTITPSATPTETVIPSATPDVQRTVVSAVDATLTAQPTDIALQPLAYDTVVAPDLGLGFVRPSEWSQDLSAEDAVIQSPDRDSGVIVQRGSRSTLVRLGLLGPQEDLQAALENMALEGQSTQVTSVENIAVDLLGVPALRLRAEDDTTVNIAYLLTLGENDNLLVLGYSPLANAASFEQQVLLPLLLSIDQGTPTESGGMATEEVAQAATEAATQAPMTAEPTQPAVTEAPTQAPVTAEPTQPAATEDSSFSTPSPTPMRDDSSAPAATEAPTELAQADAPPGFVPYDSRALQLSFFYPEDATLEQQGPFIIVSAPQNQDARVVMLRGEPSFLVSNDIVPTDESPEAALTQLLEESLGETVPVEQSDRFGAPTYTVTLDFLTGVTAAYSIVDYEAEWVFLLTVAPLNDPLDYQADFIDPILDTLQIREPVVESDEPAFEFPQTFQDPATGLSFGILDDTEVTTAEDGTFSLTLSDVQITLYLDTPQALIERGLIETDIGLISGLRSIATLNGVDDAAVNSERQMRFGRSAFVEYTQDGTLYSYHGAVVEETAAREVWLIVQMIAPPEVYQAFSDDLLTPYLESIAVEEGAPEADEGSNAPDADSMAEPTLQPTYTPNPTYTPLPTYTPIP